MLVAAIAGTTVIVAAVKYTCAIVLCMWVHLKQLQFNVWNK